jgi:hypothetical protein
MTMPNKSEKVDLSTKKILIADRGKFLPTALRMGQAFGQAWYYLFEEETSPSHDLDEIGKGFEEIKVVDDFWKYAHQADMVMFLDVYNGGLPEEVKRQGIPCYSALGSERFEIDREYLYKALYLAGLPTPTFRGRPVWEEGYVKGIDRVQRLLASDEKYNDNVIIKTSYYRADMETQVYSNAFLMQPWFETLRGKVKSGRENFKFVLEDKLDKVCEGGWDGPNLNGDSPENIMIGYEAKNKLYASKVVKSLPEPYANIEKRMKPAFKKFGYQGWYSTEVLFDKKGVAHLIDATTRCGGPPSELVIEQYPNFPQHVWDLAHGIMPTLTVEHEYGFWIGIWSSADETQALTIQAPDGCEAWLKMSNAKKVKDGYVILPKNKDGDIGAVIATGKTLEDAKNLAFERVKMVKCDELMYGEESDFEEIQKGIEAGKRLGVEF